VSFLLALGIFVALLWTLSSADMSLVRCLFQAATTNYKCGRIYTMYNFSIHKYPLRRMYFSRLPSYCWPWQLLSWLDVELCHCLIKLHLNRVRCESFEVHGSCLRSKCALYIWFFYFFSSSSSGEQFRIIHRVKLRARILDNFDL
jgi:hypothetical protein